MKIKRLLKNIFYPILALLLFIAIWAIIAHVENKPLVIPQINYIFNSFFSLIQTKTAWIAVGNTLLDTISTFILSVVLALFTSIITTIFPVLHKIINPFNTILRSAPTMAVIMLSVIWLNYNKVPLFIGFLIAFPLLYSMFREALVSVDANLLEMANVYKLSKKDKITRIYIPCVLPNMLASCQTVVSLTCKVVIAAEVMAYVNNTIGFEMFIANFMVETDILLAYTILAILLSFFLEFIFAGLKKLAEVKYGY